MLSQKQEKCSKISNYVVILFVIDFLTLSKYVVEFAVQDQNYSLVVLKKEIKEKMSRYSTSIIIC